MNKEKALELLKEYLDEYEDCFLFHRKFIEELGKIILKNASGCEKEVFSIIIKQFSFVKEQGKRVNEADHNEILKDINDEDIYYSLHVKNKIVNIRLLMSFDNSDPIFLAAFNEKGGKKATDYSKWHSIIKERLWQIRGEGRDEE